MKIGISQPTYLPWCGYIALINYVDKFIFLDHVQFEKRSWHQRNYIKSNNSKLLLTVPVISKGLRDQKICKTKINFDQDFTNKHITAIRQSYSKSKFFKLYSEEIFNILRYKYEKLVDLNVNLIIYFCEVLNINTKIDFSSNHHFTSGGSQYLLDCCRKFNCYEYISTIGSKNYLNEEDFEKNNIKLNYYQFEYKSYKQIGDKFLSNLSILDVLFNLGPDTIDYLKENFKILN